MKEFINEKNIEQALLSVFFVTLLAGLVSAVCIMGAKPQTMLITVFLTTMISRVKMFI